MGREDEQPAAAAADPPQAGPSGQEEHIRMLQAYRQDWQGGGGVLQQGARRVHKFLWWLMCFTGLDVLDYHERALFSLGYIAVAALVLAGACKQAHALVEAAREVLRRRVHVNGGGG